MRGRRTTAVVLGAALIVAGAGQAAAEEAPPPERHGPIEVPGELTYWVNPGGLTGVCESVPGGFRPWTPFGTSFITAQAFSPDGSELALNGGGYDDRPNHLIIVDLEDCSWRDLGATETIYPPELEGMEPIRDPHLGGIAWSPDGTELAVGWDGDIVVISAQTGEHLRQITHSPGVVDEIPTWHPDGDVIAYTASVDRGHFPADIWRHVMVSPADGSGGAEVLVPDAGRAQYSPDGERISFDRRRRSDVYGRNRHGLYGHARASDGGDEVLFQEGVQTTHAGIRWSPDSRYLTFSALVQVEGGTPRDPTLCYVADLTGTIVWATPGSPRGCTSPAFRPRDTSVPLPPSGPIPEVVPFPLSNPVTNRLSTVAYIYRKLDPDAPASWENSGVQQLVWIEQPPWRSVDPRRWLLPEDLCGTGWGALVGRVQGNDFSLAMFVDPSVDEPFAGDVTVVEQRHREFDAMYDAPPCDEEEPAPGAEPEPITAVFVYERLDPDRAPSWGNSGMQRLVEVRDGHSWFRDLDPGALPDDVCGPGWAAQIDWLVGTERDQVPDVIDKESGIGVLGWGTRVLQARHHSLEYVTDVPPCPDDEAQP